MEHHHQSRYLCERRAYCRDDRADQPFHGLRWFDNGGVLKNTDNGANWNHISGKLTVSAMAFAPSNNAIAYLGLLSGADAFVTKLGPSGSSILYSTYLGGGLAGEMGPKMITRCP